jgi:FMN phosphatase YigB (HAD superfamily)
MNTNLHYKTIFFDLGGILVLPESRQWIAGAVKTLKQLKKIGINLGIISNTGDLTREELRAQFLPEDFSFEIFQAELVILSFEVKDAAKPKPSLEIFNLAYTKAQSLFPGDHLFCGENAVETLAAQQAGFRALRILPIPMPNLVSEMSDLVNIIRAAPFKAPP